MAQQMRQVGGHGVLDTLLVCSQVSVTAGCEMTAKVRDGDTTNFTLGRQEPAELIFDAESLRQFVDLAQRALHDMDAQQDVNQDMNADMNVDMNVDMNAEQDTGAVPGG